MAIPKAPHPTEWPVAVRNLIARRLVARILRVWGPDKGGRAEGWRRLLVATYSGQVRDGVRLPWHLAPDQAYAYLLADLAKENADHADPTAP